MASEMLPIRKISFIVAILVIAGLLAMWLPAGVRLDASVDKLLAALEDADRGALEGLLAGDYRDQWGQNRAMAIEKAIMASKQFYAVKITKTGYRVQPQGELGAVVSLDLTLEGNGTPAAPIIMDRVHRLDEPFSLTWKREAWKPWSWKLTATANPDLKSIDP
jgi:hypothetical protein